MFGTSTAIFPNFFRISSLFWTSCNLLRPITGPYHQTNAILSTQLYEVSRNLHLQNAISPFAGAPLERPTMALEAYASQASDSIHANVLSQARLACYKARDAFYACLEKESNKKPTEIAYVGLLYPVECKKNREAYVKQCRPTWVKHFDRQYCAKKRVQRLLDDNESRRGV